MSQAHEDFSKSKLGFVKTFVLPALALFLIPSLTWAFFAHAQHRADTNARDAILARIRSDQKLSAEERARAIEFFTRVPFSRMMRDPQFAQQFDGQVQADFTTFRWMIWLSAGSIASGLGVLLLACVCVLLSLWSQLTHFLFLAVGWHVLRLFGALQTVAQGAMLVALSYWVTALWMHVYSVKLILVAAAVVLSAVCVLIGAIFKRPKLAFPVKGRLLDEDAAPQLWHNVRSLATRIGTDPPRQIVAGIDDNFFVTEHPVLIGGKEYRGRTLFVSLSLLKQLHGTEADAVVAHELAHFSGQGTTYSKRISPLLMRYDSYLAALYSGGVTLPIFYFMVFFRALYQLSLGRISRHREFRADRIAAETTNARDFASGLMRIVAYSKYRASVEQTLFKQEEVLELANISEQIERGFPAFAVSFATSTDLGEQGTAHPFDSHPPVAQRFAALGVPLSATNVQMLLSSSADGRWYRDIAKAEELEREQWSHYEEHSGTSTRRCSLIATCRRRRPSKPWCSNSFPKKRSRGRKGRWWSTLRN